VEGVDEVAGLDPEKMGRCSEEEREVQRKEWGEVHLRETHNLRW